MAITRCGNGHFFDNAKYQECPYCVSLAKERNRYEDQLRESVTIAMPKQEPVQEVNVGVYVPPKGDDEKTIGIFAKKSGGDCVTGWLVCVKGKERGRDYRLHNGNNWIGRGYQMDVCVVEDPSISRENHANIVYDYRSGKFFLAPGNGMTVYLNGEAILKAGELKARDRIGIGESEFSFVPFCGEGFVWEEEEN